MRVYQFRHFGKCRREYRSFCAVVQRQISPHHQNVVGPSVAKEWRWLDDSPMRQVSKPKEPRGRVRYLSDQERHQLLEACQASRNPYLHLIVILGLATGARRGELQGLRWPDVDLKRGTLT